jgi:hypothetical protein
MLYLTRRIKDYMHERRIQRLQDAMLRHPCAATWGAFRAAVMRRSAAQVSRMERDKGLA